MIEIKNLQDILNITVEKDLHIDSIEDEDYDDLEIYRAYSKYLGCPVGYPDAYDTLYVMQGEDVVYIGNIATIECFVRTFKGKEADDRRWRERGAKVQI